MKTPASFKHILIICFCAKLALAQSNFSVEAYKNYLDQTASMSYQQLSEKFSAGYFRSSAKTDIDQVQYMDQVDQIYNLTEYEKELLWKHGFMVTERIASESFLAGFDKVFDNDLPLYVSSDAILHAVHMSYDAILKEFEENILVPKVTDLLDALHQQMDVLDEKYKENTGLMIMLQDLDLYLTIARHLLNGGALPFYDSNKPALDDIIQLIKLESPAQYNLFAEQERIIDFSQFRPRGHYTDSATLKKYFKAMMWLGRIEIYLTAPKSDDPVQPIA